MRAKQFVIVILSALDALVVVAIGLAISLLPLSVIWLTRLDSGLGWDVFWRASVDIWLLGHGVDFTIAMDPVLASSFGLDGADVPFRLSLAPLAFAIITLLLAVRLGRRAVESGTVFLGPGVAIATFAGVDVALTLSAEHASVAPSLWQAFLIPTAIFALGVVAGARGEIGRSGGRTQRVTQALARRFESLSVASRTVLRSGITGAAISVFAVLSFSALTLAVVIAVNFTTIVGLYEGLQGGVPGGLAVTAVQLLFMPVFVVWVASWLVGPGFAIGTGSAVTPLGSTLGPLPSVPLLGALPPTHLSFGFIGLVVPVIAGFVAGYVMRGRVTTVLADAQPPRRRWALVSTGFVMCVTAGLLMAFFGWLASGSAGPGRLVNVGPNPIVLGGIFAIEVLVGSALGMLSPRPRRRTA